jgi:F-type H+-transporting ATPase subunit b
MHGVDLGLQIWTLLTFAGLLVLLARFAFRPLRQALERREQTIRAALDQAREVREQAERSLEENAKRIEEVRSEARRIISEGQRVAADMRREAEVRARAEAGELVAQARRDIELETQRGLDDLRSTVANLAVRVSRQVLEENLDENRHRELAEQFIRRLKETHGRARP